MESNADQNDSPAGLIGKRFFSVKNDKIIWRGRVLAQLNADKYLVQLYSWVTADPTNQTVVDVADMDGWLFYDTDEDWEHSAAFGTARQMMRRADRENRRAQGGTLAVHANSDSPGADTSPSTDAALPQCARG